MQEQQALVDFEFGLSQLGGNAELLNNMLGKFKEQFKDMPQLVKEQLSEDDYEGAKMRIHTAKGITGNLGLSALFECTKTFDAQLKQNKAQPETVAQFETLMEETCSEIDNIISGHAEAAVNIDGANIKDAKPKLIKLLSRHEFIDDTELRELVASIGLASEDAAQLIEYVEELQYEQAISMLVE